MSISLLADACDRPSTNQVSFPLLSTHFQMMMEVVPIFGKRTDTLHIHICRYPLPFGALNRQMGTGMPNLFFFSKNKNILISSRAAYKVILNKLENSFNAIKNYSHYVSFKNIRDLCVAINLDFSPDLFIVINLDVYLSLCATTFNLMHSLIDSYLLYRFCC